MNRVFFLIEQASADRLGIHQGTGASELTKALSLENEDLKFDHLAAKFPFVDRNSIFMPVDSNRRGVVVGWDKDTDASLGVFHGKFGNFPPFYFLDQYGQSVDMDPLLSKKLTAEEKKAMKGRIKKLFDDIQPDGKKIRDFTYDDFMLYTKRETNYFGETTSPLLTMSVGATFFANDHFSEKPFALGNYLHYNNKLGLIMDTFDYIAREFPGELAIQKDQEFLNGFNGEVNGGLLTNAPRMHRSVVGSGALKGIVNSLKRPSNAPHQKG